MMEFVSGVVWWFCGVVWWFCGVVWWFCGVVWWFCGVVWWFCGIVWWFCGVVWWLFLWCCLVVLWCCLVAIFVVFFGGFVVLFGGYFFGKKKIHLIFPPISSQSSFLPFFSPSIFCFLFFSGKKNKLRSEKKGLKWSLTRYLILLIIIN